MEVHGAPGGHEEQEGGSTRGVTVSLLQGGALLHAQVAAGNQIPGDTKTHPDEFHRSSLA